MENTNHPWSISAEEVYLSLGSREQGLTDDEVEKRLAQYGTNTFHAKEKKSPIRIFLKQFASPLIFLLICSAFITFLLKEWIDTGVILFAVFLNVVLGFYHEYHAENTLQKLTTYIKDRARVVRGGEEQEIDSSALVPGDVIKLTYGSRIPADTRIVAYNNLRVDEAVLTGESLPIEKNGEVLPLASEVSERKNIAHAGTLVVEGYATGVVYATGNNTEIGKIAGIVSGIERSETPLQKSIGHMAWIIFVVVLFIVLGIVMLGIYRGEAFLPMLVLASAVAVGAVPESLPIALTMILAVGATRIAEKKGIIRKLAAAETLGSTTLIMTDKTGTLTMAQMQLVGIYDAGMILNSTEHEDQKSFNEDQRALLKGAVENIDVLIENPEEDIDKWNFQGRPFEVNIIKAARAHNVSIERLRTQEKMIVLPFNSTNKYSVSRNNDTYTLMGAPDILLKLSKIDKDKYLSIQNWIDNTSKSGKRLIGLAKWKHHGAIPEDLPGSVGDLEFLGMFVFYDPIRPEVPKAIKDILNHGMKMVLVTGDLPGTALSVARSLEWDVSENQVLTGSQLRGMNDQDLMGMIKDTKIFARVTPEDKLRIGRLYQNLGEIVAMTGDGVNDAPALKAMDIGISLGTGSDVAKSAADLVLLDDNFETIALAIAEGRKILANVRKTFVYLMSNSLDEVVVIGGSLIFNLALPLTALQIIWVNLFTGSLPALAFAFDQDLDHERFRARNKSSIFSGPINILVFAIGVITSFALFLMYYWLMETIPEIEVARSVFFVCFASYILAITFSFRSLHMPIWKYNPFSNKKLNWSLLISVVVLFITMLSPFMRNIFNLAPMPARWLPLVIFWLVANLIIVEGIKIIANHSHNFKAHTRTK